MCVGIIFIAVALWYSIPRLCYIPAIRFNKMVIARIDPSETYHIARHREMINEMQPEAFKGAVVLIASLIFLSIVIKPNNKKGK